MPWISWKQQAYQYHVQELDVPPSLQLSILWLDDPTKVLWVDVLENAALMVGFSEWFIEKSICSIIDYALKKGWPERLPVLYLRMDSQHVRLVDRSLHQEENQVLAMLGEQPKPAKAKQRQTVQWLDDFAKKWQCPLPSFFYFCYAYGGEQGGFGPDYGFLPLEEKLDWERERFGLWSLYEALLADIPYPPQLLPFLHWGGLIFSAVDCSLPSHPVWVLDLGARQRGRPWPECRWPHQHTFTQWLDQWLADQDNGRKMWLEMFKLKK
jgi:hypothetical protein